MQAIVVSIINSYYKMIKDLSLNILLVEDDEVDVMTVQRAFRDGRIANRLYVANNGIEALEMLRGKPGQPSIIPCDRRIILLDLNLPRMSGLEFLRELRSDTSIKQIPVVVFTTSKEQGDLIETYGLNVAGYIVKPPTFEKFMEVLLTLNIYWTSCEMV
jgi:CheY-like chemotaxis protein